ncbi:leucyl-tRNA synthetase [Salinimicrobium catena]|uniref:Leucine--tRNA ligase n=1 Tax=Salinimicrobium catena TaxID=390640 RepID=A0A1H5JJG6_9FLAO|nr:leucine--tRNA ligase [Salinimicrobium catena]SDK88256.1 leucyl-tRNA synthetase [Salinimicrobium catena]SEE52713.1 leucyl-tRNA synthetase [Salinimicrobium catena]
MSYNFNQIEKKWQEYWAKNQTFKAKNNSEKPKYYVLDMFPYPSGAGLHVGHPLGYIASDIYARFKRHKGFNVLHPQGYDSFGLPAEQYAIQTGQHPAITTEANIKRYREQLDQIGFSFDWSREVRTSEPNYYRWTQWIFIQLFESWYDFEADKARPITELEKIFAAEGNSGVNAACDEDVAEFTATEWNGSSSEEKQEQLLKYRLTYLAETEVNWCPQLGTVLANDEIVNGVSERGGYPVIRKKMTQWSMRISAYAERLLQGLDKIDWTESLKESQRNWIGKSVGALVEFNIQDSEFKIPVFTTRPDTIYGVTFMTLAPEHDLVQKITTPEHKAEVDAYIEATAKRSERDRMADVKTISGVFTGAYAEHPFTKEPVPIWIGDYVLAGYGTGAVMAVPCGDQRDYDFAKHFDLPIRNIFKDVDISEEAYSGKEGTVIANSDFLNDLEYKEALNKAILELEKIGQGRGKTNYRLRDAVFSRQRYWGEPFPAYYVNGLPQMIEKEHLPLRLPEVEKYLPTETGEPPLGNASVWAWDIEKNEVVENEKIDHKTVYPLELNTMPGWAGSSWYLFRYMDAGNETEFVSEEAQKYWENVDLYIGGSEHATGHLLYSRFWTKFLYDRGMLTVDEPFKKLINQGMILGTSAFVYRLEGENKFVSKNLSEAHNVQPIHVDVSLVNASDELDIEGFKNWRPEFSDAEFITEDGKYIVGREVEKMSKSKYNVVNPDDICEDYGADTLRMYEMFLGPLEQAKPWNTAGITGVHNFLKKLWKLYHKGENFEVSEEKASAESLKSLHKTIKKVAEDIENFSFNTSVSTFMICVNELTAQKCNSREVLEPLAILIAPYAPHIAEELWEKLGHDTSVATAEYPVFEEKYLVESTKEYPISFNGKMRFTLELPMDMSKEEIEKTVLANEKTQQQLNGREPKKVIVVPGKIVNIVG